MSNIRAYHNNLSNMSNDVQVGITISDLLPFTNNTNLINGNGLHNLTKKIYKEFVGGIYDNVLKYPGISESQMIKDELGINYDVRRNFRVYDIILLLSLDDTETEILLNYFNFDAPTKNKIETKIADLRAQLNYENFNSLFEGIQEFIVAEQLDNFARPFNVTNVTIELEYIEKYYMRTIDLNTRINDLMNSYPFRLPADAITNTFKRVILKKYLMSKILTPFWRRREELSGDIPAQLIMEYFNRGSTGLDSVMVVKSLTGTGKSTQIPGLLMTNDNRKVICTQPRVQNASGLGKYVNKEYSCFNTDDYQLIGYHAGGERNFTRDTKVVYMTEDTLLHIMKSDIALEERYSAIVIDEVHERNIGTDLIIAKIRKYLVERNVNLPIVITSATIELDDYISYFSLGGGSTFTVLSDSSNYKKFVIPLDCTNREMLLTNSNANFDLWNFTEADTENIIYSLGKTESENYISDGVKLIAKIHNNTPVAKGNDILFFVPTTGIMREVDKLLTRTLKGDNYKVYYLHRARFLEMTSEEKSFIESGNTPGSRKIVLTTDISETGVTFETMKYVLDSGYRNMVIYNPLTDCKVIELVMITGNSSQQRRGRIGRVNNGYYYPLFSSVVYNEINRDRTLLNGIEPIKYRSFDPFLLDLYATMGGIFDIYNRTHINLLSNPTPEIIVRSKYKLFNLLALDENSSVTQFGKYMAKFTMPVEHSHMITCSVHYRCTQDIVALVSMISEGASSVFSGNTIFRLIDVLMDQEAPGTDTGRYSYDNFDDDGYSKYIFERQMNVLNYQSDHLAYLYIYKKFKENKGNKEWCMKYGINYEFMLKIESRKVKILNVIKDLGFPILAPETDDLNKHNRGILSCIGSGLRLNKAKHVGSGRYQLSSFDAQATIGDTLLFDPNEPISVENRYPEEIVYESLSAKVGYSGTYVYKINLVSPSSL